MNAVDKKIKKILKNKKLTMDPDFSRRLIDLSKDLVKRQQNTQSQANQKSFCMKYVPAAIAIVIIAAYPVKAATDYVSARLAEVSEEEKNKFRTMIYENNKQEHSLDKEAICYSRDLSESEQELYDDLLVQYDQGVFPKGALLISDDVHEANDETVSYAPKDNCIYLPDRSLTDEELLEIIDFYNKTDYSLRTSDTTVKYKTDMENEKRHISANDLSADNAVVSAAFYVQAMYGVAVENMEKEISGNDRDYQITFKADKLSYSVCVQVDDASFGSISMDQEGFVCYYDNLEIEEAQIQKKGKEAKAIALKLLREKSTITDVYAQYKLNAQGQVPHGSVVYLFNLENGDRLRMSYSIAEDALWGAALEEGGAGHFDQNVKKDEKRIYLQID